MVLPRAVDLQVPLGDAFVADLELLHDPAAAGVARHDADLDAVQQELLERELQHDDDGFGDVGLAGMALVDPVADRARLHRTADHVVEVDLADDLLVDEQAELVGGAGTAVAVTLLAARRERAAVGRPGRPGGADGSAPTR